MAWVSWDDIPFHGVAYQKGNTAACCNGASQGAAPDIAPNHGGGGVYQMLGWIGLM